MLANDAFRQIAEVRGIEAPRKKWEQAKDGGMAPERAYATLEVPAEMVNRMVITVFSMVWAAIVSQLFSAALRRGEHLHRL